MKSLSDRLLQTAACSRTFLEKASRDKITNFILEQQNADGGFRGRGAESDLYYTVFAVASLRALGATIPAFRIWKYARSFGMGRDLDLVHLVCLIRIRTVFPMLGASRRRLLRGLQRFESETAYMLFLKLFADVFQHAVPSDPLKIQLADPTPNLAAALMIENRSDVAAALLERTIETGGFAPSDMIKQPDLLSTATALFALICRGANLDDIQKPCILYVESLWGERGGFSGHVADEYEDVEYTFYALLSIGSLIQSMAKDYGR
jgi:prenyltransferase beta subunit